MQTVIRATKMQILEKFARSKPNAEKFFADFGRDQITVCYDQVHCQDFKISEVLETAKKALERQKITLEII